MLLSKAEDEVVLDAEPAVVSAGTEESDRSSLLGELFDACDDDGSGALSLDEFAQLFDKKLDEDMRSKFVMIDMQDCPDGKLARDECESARLLATCHVFCMCIV